jgi:hypothetical protein
LVRGAPKMTSATCLTMNRHQGTLGWFAHEKVRSCVILEKVEALISPRTSAKRDSKSHVRPRDQDACLDLRLKI